MTDTAKTDTAALLLEAADHIESFSRVMCGELVARLRREAKSSETATTSRDEDRKTNICFSVQWTLEDSQAAQAQGWDLFDAGYRFELEVVTENPAGFGDGADDDAVAWVIQRALKGDKTCVKGLIMSGLLDPGWFAADLSNAVASKRIVPLDCKGRPSKPRSHVAYRSESESQKAVEPTLSVKGLRGPARFAGPAGPKTGTP